MTKESVSILSIVINLILALLKLGIGFFVGSAALVADGIHSSLDIVSSGATYLGIKVARKPADKEHPYGHWRAETIASFVVIFLLLISVVWIIYEGASSIIEKESIQITFPVLLIVVFSIIINEVMARLKFNIGKKNDSLALIADGEHSRADSLSSVAVLVGLFLTRWVTQADGAAAIFVGLYILHETYILSGQTIDNLLDVANPIIEEKIRKICQDEEIDLLQIKSRKLGMENFVELKIGLNRQWKIERASEVTKNLEKLLLKRVENLKFVVIQVISHDFKRGYIKARNGHLTQFKNMAQAVSFEKRGIRTIISVKDGKFYNDFGAPEYLVIDQDKNGDIIQKRIVKNPYFTVGRGHGVRFVKAIEADRIITGEIGSGAMVILKEMGVGFEIIPKDTAIEEIIKEKLSST